MSTADLASLVSRLEAVTSRLEKAASRGGGGDAGPTDASVVDYEAYISQHIDPFVAATSKVGSDQVKAAASLVKKLAEEQKKFLAIVAKHAEPSQAVLAKLLEPLSEIITDIGRIKDRTFKDKDFSSYTAAINEGVSAFGWVTVSPAPAPYVKECGNGAQFYTNRILKDKQDKEWVKAWTSVFPPLHDYVKQYHTTGTNWNKDAAIFTSFSLPSFVIQKPQVPPKPEHLKAAQDQSRPPPPQRAAPTVEEYREIEMLPPPPPPLPSPPRDGNLAFMPPPPPPPPKTAPLSPKTVAKSGTTDHAASQALFSEINRKGLEIGKGLKKVTDDMKTHKNPTLRGATPYKGPATKVAPVAKPAKAGPVKTPKLELQGKKWIVEYQSGRNDLVIDTATMKHTVYIFKCENCTINVKNKVNQIILDGCKKTGVVFENVVSSLEFVNCQSVQGQVTGRLPTASIEKTDGCLLYLSKESMDCQIITAKSSEMNISIPKDDGDFAEYPIVEQFKSVWNGKEFVTEPSESAE